MLLEVKTVAVRNSSHLFGGAVLEHVLERGVKDKYCQATLHMQIKCQRINTLLKKKKCISKALGSQ